jgi:hypothetical protein
MFMRPSKSDKNVSSRRHIEVAVPSLTTLEIIRQALYCTQLDVVLTQ